jgi:hypothetical protein
LSADRQPIVFEAFKKWQAVCVILRLIVYVHKNGIGKYEFIAPITLNLAAVPTGQRLRVHKVFLPGVWLKSIREPILVIVRILPLENVPILSSTLAI